ncbi:MAG TPA: biopolymer transporter ExbD [Paracoccaceae bacterium]|nr:biopolymer transporter ExbD [Paracoccaceae bacterium]
MRRGAPAFGFRRPRREVDEDARILPLINVVFLLLVFFMVTGQLAAIDPFPIDPPESTSEGPSAEGHLIAFGAGGELALDGEVMGEDALLATLGPQLSGSGAPEIRIKADGGAEAMALVELLNRLREIGAEKVVLMTVPEGP